MTTLAQRPLFPQRHKPADNCVYSGLTVILDEPSRFDRNELCSGVSGAYFENSLLAAGHPEINRRTVDLRTLNSLQNSGLLPDTKCVLLMGQNSLNMFKQGVTLNEQRGAPFTVGGMTMLATYLPQDTHDPRNFFLREDEDEEGGKKEDEGKTTHGRTQRKNWRFWMRQDIKKAVRLTKTYPLVLPEFNTHLWPSIEEVLPLLLNTKGKELYFDIETDSNLQMTCFGFSFDARDVYVVPMLQTHEVPQRYYYGDTHKLLRALTIALRDNTVVIHNSSFDLFVLAYRYGIPLTGKVYDTMCAHNRCYIEIEKSLGHVISLYTDLPYHKNEGVFEPHNWAQANQLYNYNAKDVFALTQIKPEIDRTAARLKAAESVQQINRMVLPYLTMSLHGIRLDTQKIAKIVDEHERHNVQMKRILSVLTGTDFNPLSPKQVAKYLYDDLGIKRPDDKLTAEGTLLQLLLKRDIPAIYPILTFRGNQKRISKASVKTKRADPRYYFGPYLHEGDCPRITTSWRLSKTVTMRLGSTKLLGRWGDNLQNWEKALRAVIIPDPGYCFLQADQSGAEALIVAYLCTPGTFRDLFLYSINPHCFMALHLFHEKFKAISGMDLEPFTRLSPKQLANHPKWAEIQKLIKSSDDWAPERRYYYIGKQSNHSLNYDCKARAFRLNVLTKSEGAVSLSMDEAQRVIDTRMHLFPELPRWHADVVLQARKTNILRNLFGHPRVVTQLIHEGMYKELYAFIPQSTVGQITNYAITELQERIDGGDELLTRSDTSVMQNNHDSILLQCRPEFKEDVGRELQKHLNRKLVSPRGEPFSMKSDIQWSMTSWKEMEALKL